jgi:hypothetical protein
LSLNNSASDFFLTAGCYRDDSSKPRVPGDIEVKGEDSDANGYGRDGEAEVGWEESVSICRHGRRVDFQMMVFSIEEMFWAGLDILDGSASGRVLCGQSVIITGNWFVWSVGWICCKFEYAV